MVYLKGIILFVIHFTSINLINECKAKNLNPEKNLFSIFHDDFMNYKVSLTKFINAERYKRDSSLLNVKWNHLWAKSIENSNPALMKNVNNKIFILSKDKVYSLNREVTSFKLTPIISVEDIADQIIFIESTEWKNILFLILGLKNGQCRLMTATNDVDFTIRQTISTSDNPVDAEFFVMDNQLFVIIIFNQMDNAKVGIRIYRWRNTHLDEEPFHNILTVGAISVTTFTYEGSIMFIIGQENRDRKQISSQVLKLKRNGVIEKIHYLSTKDPVGVKHFTMSEENFILVLERNQSSTIYWWEGKEFVQWLSLPNIFGQMAFSVGYVRNNTLILFYKENIVDVYLMDWQKLHKLTTVGFDGKVVNAALYEDGKVNLVIVVSKKSQMDIQLMELFINSPDEDIDTHSNHSSGKHGNVVECVKKLEASVNDAEDQIRSIQQKVPNILFTNQPANIRSIKVLGPDSAVIIEEGRMKEVSFQNSVNNLRLETINTKLSELKRKIVIIGKKFKDENIFGRASLEIEGNLKIEEAIINSIRTPLVNNKPFDPNKLISLTRKQKLEANIYSPQVNVKWVVADSINEKMIKNLVPRGNIIKSPQTLNSLVCNNINLIEKPLINGMNITYLMLHGTNITIKENIMVENLEVTSMKAKIINTEQDVQKLLTEARNKNIENLRLLDNTFIQNLKIQRVNGININEFLDSLVLKDRNNTITGDLYYKHGLRVDELVAKRIDFFVKSYDIKDLSYSRVSGERVKRDATDQTKKKRKLIVYKGNVKIKGSLEVNKLKFINSTLSLRNHSKPILMSEINQTFWTKGSNQTISVPVVFENGISVKDDLDVQVVNNLNISEYWNNTVMSTSLMFENISIHQFVLSGKSNNQNNVDFKYLNESIVKREGTYFITGKKVFDKLYIKNLQGKRINNMKTSQFFLSENISDWDNVVIKNLTVGGNINTEFLNGHSTSKFENIVLANKDYNISSLRINNLTGNIVGLKTLNNLEFQQLIDVYDIIRNKSDLKINFNGSLTVPAILSTQTVNKKNLKDILPLVINGSNPSVIRGEKIFKSQLIVGQDFSMESLNKENFTEFYNSRLSKSRKQNITGLYSMKHTKIGNLSTNIINGVEVDNIVFINETDMLIKSDLKFNKLTVFNNLTASDVLDGCVLPQVEETLTFTNEVSWASLKVKDDVQWNSNSSGDIQRLIDYAMVKDKDQNITGMVSFDSPVEATHLETQFINDVNITFFMDDAILKNKPNQVVRGFTNFKDEITCSRIDVLGDTTIPIINDINIQELSSKLVMHNINSNITGYKIFQNGFRSNKLICKEGINGLKAEDIVTDSTNTSILPETVFNSLEIIESLNVENINNLNLNKFIQDIIKLDSTSEQTITGELIFKENVHLAGDSFIKSINSINIDETLSTDSFNSSMQYVYGCTAIKADTAFNGNLTVDFINGKQLSKLYHSAVLNTGNVTIKGNLVFNNEQSINTIDAENFYLNGDKVHHIHKKFDKQP